MKTTSFGSLTVFALIFVLILFPIHFQQANQLREQERTQEIMMYYDGALNTAVQDAGVALGFNERQQQEDVRYDSVKLYRPDKESAVEAFYRTMYTNLDLLDDPVGQEVLKRYVPAIAVIDYDGYWIYTDETYTDDEGETVTGQVWKAKKPFAYADAAGNSLSFTLDDYVYAYSASSGTWHKGNRADVAAETGAEIPLLNDEETFEQVRRLTIVNAIQDDLAYYINLHNEYVRGLGFTYTFTLPTISQEEWNNTIDDVGFIAFFQGVPIGVHQYNRYALGGGRLVKKPAVYGVVRGDRKLYYREECYTSSDTLVEKFSSEKDAAAAGYFPAPCENQ